MGSISHYPSLIQNYLNLSNGKSHPLIIVVPTKKLNENIVKQKIYTVIISFISD